MGLYLGNTRYRLFVGDDRVKPYLKNNWYITSGLVCHLDAIYNTGLITPHDNNAETWVDLTGNGHNVPVAEFMGTQLSGWEDNALVALDCYNVPFAIDCKDYVTIEIGFLQNGYQAVFNSGDGLNKMVAFRPSTNTIQFYNISNTTSSYISNDGRIFASGVHYPTPEAPLIYSNGILQPYIGSDTWNKNQTSQHTCLGRGLSTSYNFSGKYYSIRLYNRALTPEEIKHNFEIDKIRYNILPYDAEVEFLESTGTQYINTGIVCNIDYTIEIEALVTSYKQEGLLGSRQSSSSKQHCLIFPSDKNQLRYSCRDTSNLAANLLFVDFSLNTWHNVIIKYNNLYLDGVAYAYSKATRFTIPHVYYLFAVNTNGSATNLGTKYIRKLKISDQNNNVIMDLIPVRVGQVGYMYDKVSRQLFGNSGTGNFILGNDKT